MKIKKEVSISSILFLVIVISLVFIQYENNVYQNMVFSWKNTLETSNNAMEILATKEKVISFYKEDSKKYHFSRYDQNLKNLYENSHSMALGKLIQLTHQKDDTAFLLLMMDFPQSVTKDMIEKMGSTTKSASVFYAIGTAYANAKVVEKNDDKAAFYWLKAYQVNYHRLAARSISQYYAKNGDLKNAYLFALRAKIIVNDDKKMIYGLSNEEREKIISFNRDNPLSDQYVINNK